MRVRLLAAGICVVLLVSINSIALVSPTDAIMATTPDEQETIVFTLSFWNDNIHNGPYGGEMLFIDALMVILTQLESMQWHQSSLISSNSGTPKEFREENFVENRSHHAGRRNYRNCTFVYLAISCAFIN
jgi:hypothetical protein